MKDKFCVEYSYLKKLLRGTKYCSINKFDRTKGCLINDNWEDNPRLVRNILTTPTPASTKIFLSAYYSEYYSVPRLRVCLSFNLEGKRRFDEAVIYCNLTPKLLKIALDNGYEIVYLLSENLDSHIEHINYCIKTAKKSLKVCQELKKILEEHSYDGKILSL